MGLDAHIYAIKPFVPKVDLRRFRKEYALDEFMADGYYAAGGSDEFNCEKFYLDDDIIDELEEALSSGSLGANLVEDSDKLVETIRVFLDQKYDVYYWSWG